MTATQQIQTILNTPKAKPAEPAWPEALHTAVKALGYSSYSIDRVRLAKTSPHIHFQVNYGCRGESCSDDYTLPLSVLEAEDVKEATELHIIHVKFLRASRRTQELQRELKDTEQEVLDARNDYYKRSGVVLMDTEEASILLQDD